MNDKAVVKNAYGFYEAVERPSPEELSKYYEEKYYQEGKGSYEKEGYTQDEKRYFHNKLEQKFIAACKANPALADGPRSFLDVGVGEGWSLEYFRQKGWDCIGLDYSSHGCEACNPGCSDLLITGDIYENLSAIVSAERKFDLILLDNVLEHVLDPLKLMEDLLEVVAQRGVLIVEVPNDFSPLQEYLVDKDYVSRNYWVVLPDHLSYFCKDGLVRLAREAGWDAASVMSDYPVDFNLLNPNTNYVESPAVGKSCHVERVQAENLLHDISPEKTNALYEALAELGLGRDLTGVFVKSGTSAGLA